MTIRLALGVWILIVNSSCAIQTPLTQSTFSKQSFPDTIGTISNSVDSAHWQGSSLWSQLVFLNETDTVNWREAEVRLTLLSDEILQAEYFVNGSKSDCALINGHLSENQFALKTQHKYDPLIVLIAVYANSKTRLALEDPTTLLVENKRSALVLLGSVMPIFGAPAAPSRYRYQRK